MKKKIYDFDVRFDSDVRRACEEAKIEYQGSKDLDKASSSYKKFVSTLQEKLIKENINIVQVQNQKYYEG